MSSLANRRLSMYSPPARYSPHPPPPHQAQAHFYGAPDINVPGLGLQPGANGYYCGFDKLPRDKSSETVLLSGYDGGLKVHSVTKRGTVQLWDLTGIRGGVFSAKILPRTVESDQNGTFPLVALVVHGPVWESRTEDRGKEQLNSPERPLTPSEVPVSPSFPAFENDLDTEEYYQTSVELYSISQNRHIGTLLTLPKRPFVVLPGSPLFEPPVPDGALTIRADADMLVIASGQSGEIWAFRYGGDGESSHYSCIGKTWTTVQQGSTTELAVMGDWNMYDGPPARKQYKAAVLSLNGRYLAYCPPSLSSQVTVGAVVPPYSANSRIPGFSARAPPQLPTVNCLVDTPGNESMMKQILQVGTQKFIEGASYLGGQGVQAWNNYWSKPHQGQSPPEGFAHTAQGNNGTRFPPTHGGMAPAPVVSKEPGLISILDLDSLAAKAAQGGLSVHPLATFRVPHGCSFLSFAPSGLALFTASSKGDTQFVWDLMRIQYPHTSFLKANLPGVMASGPQVRQIAQFTRMTIARIVDVVWTSPHGERAAMVTEPGTVHVLDLPASAFDWPPPIRKTPLSKPDEEVALPTFNATSIVSNAGSAVSSILSARPFSRRRRSTAGMSAKTVTVQAGQSTQALAAGISRSVGAATGKMNELRKSGANRLHLPTSPTVPVRGCLMLINGKKHDTVLVVGNGIVRIYTIKTRQADRPADKQKASRGAQFIELRLPALPASQVGPRVVPPSNDQGNKDTDTDPRYNGHTSPVPLINYHTRGTESSIPHAEIESNAPYQPFHTDHRRVALHIYSNDESSLHSPSLSALITPLHVTPTKKISSPRPQRTKLLAFGLPIATNRLDIGPLQSDDDDLDSSRGIPSSTIERIMREDGEEIVITTRRRKGISRSGMGDFDDGGGDEDDWAILDIARQQV